VTGCAGNVGSNLTAALLRQKYAVTGIDNFFSGTPGNMQHFQADPLFSFHEGSITDTGFLKTIFAQHGPFSAVFHLAAIISVPYSMEHADETMRVNHEASLDLHARTGETGQGTFVFAGSAAEYGRPLSEPAREEDAGDPVSPYGLSKHLVSLAIEKSGFGASLRFFNIYGPTRAKPGPYDGVVRLFLDRAGKGLAPLVLGDGRQTRDFLFLGTLWRRCCEPPSLGPACPWSAFTTSARGRARASRNSPITFLNSTVWRNTHSPARNVRAIFAFPWPIRQNSIRRQAGRREP